VASGALSASASRCIARPNSAPDATTASTRSATDSENFDAVGRWRDKDNGQPVDSLGELRTGERFRGPAELKSILLARKEQFAKTLSSRLLEFALGRQLRYFDEQVTDKLATALVTSGWKHRRCSRLWSRVILSNISRSLPNDQNFPTHDAARRRRLRISSAARVMSPAAPTPPKRLVCLFQPNGVYPKAWDVNGVGKDFEWSPILEPLALYKEDVLIISNLGTPAVGHVAATSAILTGTP